MITDFGQWAAATQLVNAAWMYLKGTSDGKKTDPLIYLLCFIFSYFTIDEYLVYFEVLNPEEMTS